jgi:hypothetical protein
VQGLRTLTARRGLSSAAAETGLRRRHGDKPVAPFLLHRGSVDFGPAIERRADTAFQETKRGGTGDTPLKGALGRTGDSGGRGRRRRRKMG